LVGGNGVINSPDGIKISFTMEPDKAGGVLRQGARDGRPVSDIYFVGEITSQRVAHIRQILARYPSTQAASDIRPAVNFWIDCPGGDVYAAMVLGRLLRSNRAMISILGDAQCASACILVWVGAPMRAIAPGAQLIIHRPYNFATAGTAFSATSAEWKAMQADIRAYLTEMNTPITLLDAMNQVPPEASHVLTGNELDQYLMSGNDPAWNELWDTTQASKRGISRGKYLELRAQYNHCIESRQGSYADCARVFPPYPKK
jgi:ATP-dependent protease ClpP protease subunit